MSAGSGDEDIFIPPNEINSAMQGDQVLVEVEPPKADGRLQGRIVRILERRNPTVVGIFRYADPGRGYRQNVVIPFDERMTQPILIPPGAGDPARRRIRHAASRARRVKHCLRPKPESAERERPGGVDVEITSWPTPTRPPIGRVIEVLGSPDDFGVDVEMMIRKHQLPRIFPEMSSPKLAQSPISTRRLWPAGRRFSRSAHRHHRRRNRPRLR